MRAWKFQKPEHKAKFGDKAPWSVGWYDSAGRRHSKKIGAKSLSERYRKRKEAELALGLVEPQRVKWSDFTAQFLRTTRPGRATDTIAAYQLSLDTFYRLMKPAYVDAVTTAMIDNFAAKRKDTRLSTSGEMQKAEVSPATVNKDLRAIRAALRKAKQWGMIRETPYITFLREPKRDPDFYDDTDFALLYAACDTMTLPRAANYDPADWWRALLTFAYLTGWRIGQILALERDNLDFASGTAFVPAENTKGKRDATVKLPPAVLDHVKPILGFGRMVFGWPHHERTLWAHFDKLKLAARIDRPGAFHRFRYGFANANVDSLTGAELQHLMQHASEATTKRYINHAHRMQRAKYASKVHVPAVLLGEAS